MKISLSTCQVKKLTKKIIKADCFYSKCPDSFRRYPPGQENLLVVLFINLPQSRLHSV